MMTDPGKKEIRPACEADIPAVLEVLDAARGIMRASGNRFQWGDAYPAAEDILRDILCGGGHVMTEGGAVVAYFAFLPSPEPTYARIYDGAWLEDTLPYHVIHRIGSRPEVHGVFGAMMEWAFSRERNIRIDTHRDNLIMQHLLQENDFTYCGIIFLASGDERLAYQRLDR